MGALVFVGGGALTGNAMGDYTQSRAGVFLEAASEATYYVDGAEGDDENDGAAEAPFATLTHAVDSVPSGSRVVIAAGVYRLDEIRFGPAGSGPHTMTVFEAAPGARVIVVGSEDRTPQVGFAAYVRVQGLWFGGSGMRASGGIFGTGTTPGGIEVVDCTIFGYTTGILAGTSMDLFVHGNRVVHNGNGHFDHGFYMSGGTAPNVSHHMITDSNLFVAGEGYGVHEWHRPNSTVVTRNTVVRHSYGIVINGLEHLVFNNFVYDSQGATSGPNGLQIETGDDDEQLRSLVANNLLGPNAPLIGKYEASTVSHNGFLGVDARGHDSVSLPVEEFESHVGVTREAIDEAVALLDEAFNRPIDDIFADDRIESALRTLELRVPTTSPLATAGSAWYDPSLPAPIGPGADAPLTKAMFWNAFRKRDRADYDRNGERTNQGPMVDAGDDLTVVDLDDSVPLEASITDDDSGTVETEWTQLSGPGEVRFADTSAPTTSATFDTPGVYLLHVYVTDGQPDGDGALYAGDVVRVRVGDPDDWGQGGAGGSISSTAAGGTRQASASGASDDGGCGCRAGDRRATPWWSIAILLGLGGLVLKQALSAGRRLF